MNYLEECDAGSKEGDFLKEWEVVYAADAYKLIVDELFEKTSKKLGLKTPLEYPSREDIESNKKITYWIDVVVNTVDYGMSIYSGKNTTNSIASYNSKEFVKKELLIHLVTEVKNNAIEDVEYLNVIGNLASFDGWKKEIPSTLVQGTQKLNDYIKDTKKIDFTHLKLTRKVDFSVNDKFKVVIFKKGEDIVVAIDDKELKDEKILPSSIDLLQLLCCKIMTNFKNNRVFITGLDKGATLGVLCNYMLDKSLGNNYFFTVKPMSLNNCINFTNEDVFKKYKSPYQVFSGTVKSGFIEMSIVAAGIFFTGGACLIPYAIFIGFKSLVSAPLKLLNTLAFNIKYELLKKYGLIEEIKIPKISGYITDRVYEGNSIPIMTEGPMGYISIKGSHALFLIMTSKTQEGIRIYPDTAFSHTTIVESYRKNKKDVEYLVKCADDLWYHLVRGKTGVYEVVGYKVAREGYYEKNTIAISVSSSFLGKVFNKVFETDDFDKLQEAEYLFSTMKLTGKLQRAYIKKSSKGYKSYYIKCVTKDKVKKEFISSTSNLNEVIPIISSYIPKSSVNEHIFLPYIQKNGSIGSELRKEYIKSVFKDTVKISLEKKTYSSSYLKSKETSAILYEIMRNYNNIHTIQNQGMQAFYFYETICRQKADFFKPFVQTISYNANDNKAVIEIETEEMKYDYNPKVPLTKDRVELFIPIDTKKNSKFNDVANIILPPMTINNKNNQVYCDPLALDSHIKKLGKDAPKDLSYNKNDIISEKTKNEKKEYYGYVKKVIKSDKYEQNYDSKEQNQFRQKVFEDDVYKEHEGVDFSYGRQNPLCCTHPRVYSPVNGIVKSQKNGKIVIMNTEHKKDYFGKDTVVPYYHIIEHLHTVLVKNETVVKEGQVIGTMGGRCTNSGTPHKYLQHVHYEIRICRRYYTGGIKTGISPKGMNKEEAKRFKAKLDAENRDRVIDPYLFWEKGIESGLDYPEDEVKNKKIGGGL